MTLWNCANVGCHNTVSEKGAVCSECRSGSLIPDGGQATLEADTSKLQLVRPERRGDYGVYCPDCATNIAASKSGGHPVPDDVPADACYGWFCDDCQNVMPTNTDEDARTFNSKMTAVEAEFRDGVKRYIPVSKANVETITDGGTIDDSREIVPAAGGGSIAVYTDRDIPDDTKSIETTCDRLREAVNEDLGDDYPSVHLHCDGDALAVTNHENALDPDAPALKDLSGVERCEAVKTSETAERVLVNRSYLTQTLDALDGTVEVHIESKVRPLILDDGADRAVIAPLGPVEELREEFRKGDPVADGGTAGVRDPYPDEDLNTEPLNGDDSDGDDRRDLTGETVRAPAISEGVEFRVVNDLGDELHLKDGTLEYPHVRRDVVEVESR